MKKLLMFLCLGSTYTYAQEPLDIVITLKAGSDHPTAEDVQEDGSLSPPPSAYILSAFNAYPPSAVSFVMKLRAYGDLKALIDSKPNWSRAQS